IHVIRVCVLYSVLTYVPAMRVLTMHLIGDKADWRMGGFEPPVRKHIKLISCQMLGIAIHRDERETCYGFCNVIALAISNSRIGEGLFSAGAVEKKRRVLARIFLTNVPVSVGACSCRNKADFESPDPKIHLRH